VLELTALPGIDRENWLPLVQETDVLLVSGGDALYLSHWMRESGLADLLPSLHETAWVGFSAGSMALTSRIGEDFVFWRPPAGGDEALGVVDFSIFPHVDHVDLPENTMAAAEQWASRDPESGVLQSTMRPPSKSSTTLLRSSPRGTGSCSPTTRKRAKRAEQRPRSAARVRGNTP
jgi:hypothetical protein